MRVNKPKARYLYLLLSTLVLSCEAGADSMRVYQWTDAQGSPTSATRTRPTASPPSPRTIYIAGPSGSAKGGATPIKPLSPPSTAPAAAVVKGPPRIVSPANEETIRNGDGSINVIVEVQLPAGYQLVYYIDGKGTAPTQAVSYELTGVERGDQPSR